MDQGNLYIRRRSKGTVITPLGLGTLGVCLNGLDGAAEYAILVEPAGIDQPAAMNHHVETAVAKVDPSLEELIGLMEMNGLGIDLLKKTARAAETCPEIGPNRWPEGPVQRGKSE